MPYPRRTESADARAALMAMLPSQFPLEPATISRIRTRYLQAERPSPYRVPTSLSASSKSKQSEPKFKRNSPPGKCRAARLESSLGLGWGAFLKDETLRTLDGTVVRAAQTRTPVIALPPPCAGDSMRDCCFTERDADRSVLCSSNNSSSGGVRGGEDSEMPSCGAFANFDCELYTPFDDLEMPAAPLWVHDPLYLGGRDDVKAADEMFMMFIQLDETCMEVD
ncbi:hypothetical protein DFH08DRAFT_845611 [Mycena albidolilacea]|uniref:Uncharacterized protein n=1 Tax=Mycena albidolilacea TaxID=1033008 RepID=A0AAD7AHW4_9AGAR|nr:hypothetical protein DFH08DRAFT_845611 [Mycena albidolilacea]